MYRYIYIHTQSVSQAWGHMRPQLFCKLHKNVKREKLLHITCFWSQVLDSFLNLGQAVMALKSLHTNNEVLPDNADAASFQALRIR